MIPSASPILAAFQRQTSRAQHTAATTAATEESPAPNEQPLHSPLPNTQQTAAAALPDDAVTAPSSRALQNVLTRAQRAQIVKWMIGTADKDGPTRIASRAVREFPSFFRSSTNANLTKASRLWKTRADYTNDEGNVFLRGTTSTITRITTRGFKRVNVKASSGRGRKRTPWVAALHEELVNEFDRLRKLGVKFNCKTLRSLALHLINHEETPGYSRHLFDQRSGKRIVDMITARWIQTFCERYRIVSRALTGKLLTSPAKELFIEKEVAFHLGQMARQFRSGDLDENDVENADETHFVINLDNGRTLGFSGEEEIKYADVVSGGEGMTMVVRLSGGRDARIEAPFMVFRNRSRSYPIRGTPDNVAGVSYRSGPKGWMDTQVMPEWLKEEKVIKALPHGRKRVLYVDNCSGHNETEALTQAQHNINTEIRYFPKNATHLIQPCDSFVIQKIKRAWCTRWEEYKMEMIRNNQWSAGSGMLPNPGRSHFLKLAVAAVRDVNGQRDENGLSYARKAMIRTGMALNCNGRWEEHLLFPRLQKIIETHRNHFDGESVVESNAADAE